MSTEQPAGANAGHHEALREIYVYRDMAEGFITSPQLTQENINIAIAALQQTRAKMLRHGITSIPRRW